ncbi:MAG: hypothetical protein ACYTXA_19700 [Nostoc sp.]
MLSSAEKLDNLELSAIVARTGKQATYSGRTRRLWRTYNPVRIRLYPTNLP